MVNTNISGADTCKAHEAHQKIAVTGTRVKESSYSCRVSGNWEAREYRANSLSLLLSNKSSTKNVVSSKGVSFSELTRYGNG